MVRCGHLVHASFVLVTGCQGPARISAVVDEEFPTVLHLSWTGDRAGVGVVRWDDPDGNEHEVREDRAGTDHEFALVGLLPESSQVLEAILLEDGVEDVVGEVTVDMPVAPSPIPWTVVEGALEAGGYVLTHVLTMGDQDSVVIWDARGRPAWYYVTSQGDRIFTVNLAGDGTLWFTSYPANYLDTLGEVQHAALDGSLHESWASDRMLGATPLPEGGFGHITRRYRPYEGGLLLWDVIEERAPDGRTRRVFDFADWFEPEALCSHWNWTLPGIEVPLWNWTHANSLVLSEDGSAWYLMVRHYDALLKIDRATGDLLWVMGGPYGEFEFTVPGSEWSHPHATVLEDDRLLVMDNGNHRSPPVSRAMVFKYDEDARTVTAVRSIYEPDGGLVDLLGDVKDLPDGGLLVSWSTKGRIDAYDASDRLEWSLTSELGTGTGRATWVPSLDLP